MATTDNGRKAGYTFAIIFTFLILLACNTEEVHILALGMDASLLTRMKELEAENRQLKKMYAEERLKAEIIQEAMAKKW